MSVGKNVLAEIFGRFVGFERVCFIQHIFFREKRENAKFFAGREGQKKTREKNKLTSLTSRSYLKQRRRRSLLRCTALAVRHLRERVGCVTMRAELDVQMRAELVVRQG